MTSTPTVRYPLVQLDLLNDTVVLPKSVGPDGQPEIEYGEPELLADKFVQREIDPELKVALMEKIGEFWNTDVDRLEAFAFYTDGTYLCQRKRQKYDFSRHFLPSGITIRNFITNGIQNVKKEPSTLRFVILRDI